MKKILLFSLLALLFTAASTNAAYAQKKGKKKSSKTDEYFDDSGFANKLWYGGNFTLGVASDQFQSQFAIGLTPMVGYKLIGDYVSTGPRAGFVYNNYRLKYSSSNVIKSNVVSYTLGWFVRVKPLPNTLPNLFAHGEYEYENAGIPYLTSGGDIQIERYNFNNNYVGLGYNSGGLVAYEILALYNLSVPDNSAASPLTLRFGLTYKF